MSRLSIVICLLIWKGNCDINFKGIVTIQKIGETSSFIYLSKANSFDVSKMSLFILIKLLQPWADRTLLKTWQYEMKFHLKCGLYSEMMKISDDVTVAILKTDVNGILSIISRVTLWFF